MNEYLLNSYGDISSNNLSFDKNGQIQDIVDEAVSKASEKTDEIVDEKINDLVNNAPEALDTLGEIAEKINEIETESLVTMTDVNNAINDALEEYTDTETLQANYLKSSDAEGFSRARTPRNRTNRRAITSWRVTLTTISRARTPKDCISLRAITS